MKKKEDMIPGKRYRGYGFINEFKEFCFEPEETGAHAGREKIIVSKGGIKVSETKNLIIVKFNLDKRTNNLEYIKYLTNTYNKLMTIFQQYEL